MCSRNNGSALECVEITESQAPFPDPDAFLTGFVAIILAKGKKMDS